jgi:SAM-dependent methyltransferase
MIPHLRTARTAASEPDEPLIESAPLAWREAPARCFRDAESGTSCRAYHQVWQYLRLLGFISAVRTNGEFFLRQFATLASTGRHPRVLVSATADYSMVAHVAHAYGAARQPVHVTVADRCGTSLFLNRWYAERHALSLETVQGDLRALETDRAFDIVCTHSVLGRFGAEARAQLVRRWHAVLRPGGVVITTQRIRPADTTLRSRYSDAEARALATSVAAAARASALPLGVEAAALEEAVFAYARQKGGYVIGSTRSVTDLFEETGFEVLVADEGGGAAERARDRSSSPRAAADTFRMRLVARKR